MSKPKRSKDTETEDVICSHCGKYGPPGELIPILSGGWYHDACWQAWRAGELK